MQMVIQKSQVKTAKSSHVKMGGVNDLYDKQISHRLPWTKFLNILCPISTRYFDFSPSSSPCSQQYVSSPQP